MTMRSPINPPLYAFGALALFIVSVTVLVVTGHADGQLFMGFVISTLPSIVAAMFAERASKDIRNHVVAEKAKEGAKEALEESGVGDDPSDPAQVGAVLEARGLGDTPATDDDA